MYPLNTLIEMMLYSFISYYYLALLTNSILNGNANEVALST
jgi:hypothetical protein